MIQNNMKEQGLPRVLALFSQFVDNVGCERALCFSVLVEEHNPRNPDTKGGMGVELLTRKEAAAELGISVNTLDKLREERKIGFYQTCYGGRVRFSRAHLEKYIEKIEKPPVERGRRRT